MAREVSSDEHSTTYMMPSHFVAKENEMIANGINPQLANQIYQNGGFMLFSNLPTKDVTVGIDYRNFTPTEKFMGFKMIPPGLHYFTVKYKDAPTISFFAWFDFGSVFAPKWNKTNEDFEDSLYSDFWPEDASTERQEQARHMLKSYDDRLACYPYGQIREWQQLTSHISFEVFKRLRPANKMGKISEQHEFETKEGEQERLQGTSEGISQVNKDHPTRLRFKEEGGLPVFKYKEGGKIFFSDLAENIGGQHYTDTRLERALKKVSYKELLGEVQYAHVIFLVGQSYVGLEQWKRLLHLLSDCFKDLKKQKALFEEFIVLFYFQLKFMEGDFFEDIFTGDNFLKTVIPMLFANIEDSGDASEILKKRSKQLKMFCEKKFQRSFDYT